ncbi:lonely Cys domain-containing protein, partial [Streptomyces sp. NPDC002403]
MDLALELARTVANAIGEPVWTSTGRAGVSFDEETGMTYPARFDDDPGKQPVGQWMVSPPGLLPPPGTEPSSSGQWLYTMEDGKRLWVLDQELITYSVIHPVTGESIGRSIVSEIEQVAAEAVDYISQLLSARFMYHSDPAYAGFAPVGTMPTLWADADPGTRMYVFAGHTDEYGRFLWLARINGEVKELWGTPRSAGGYLKRRPSLNRLREEAQGRPVPILAARCRVGSVPQGAVDPLATGESGQILATEAGAPLYAPTYNLGMGVSGPAKRKLYIAADSRGGLGRWKEFRPEPEGEALEELARAMGLAADQAARLVRALRQVFGPTAELDPLLVAGVGALERLRQADPVFDGTGPFTLAFFQHAAQQLRRATGQPALAVDAEADADAHRVLLAYAQGWAQASADGGQFFPLTAHLPLPAVQALHQVWARASASATDAVLRNVNSARLVNGPVIGPVTEDDRRTLAFWSLVRAEDALGAWGGLTDDLVRHVLHLDETQPVTPQRRNTVRVLVAHAIAAGRTGTGPAAWAAHHLETTTQLLSAATLTRSTHPKTWGRNFTSRPINKLHLDATALGEHSFLVAAVGRDYADLAEPNGVRHRVSFDEVAELLTADPAFYVPWVTIVLLVSGDPAGRVALAHAIADRTGRRVVHYNSPDGLTVTDA